MKKRLVALEIRARWALLSSWLLLLALISSHFVASAAVIAVDEAAFPSGSSLITFTGLLDGTEVNGLTVDGVLFGYSLGNGQVIIDGGPGITNTIDPPNIVSIGDPSGIVTMMLPASATLFGYGYAILSDVPVANATTITLFSGATNVGALSYDGVPDPLFTGGFAGIESTIPFDRVEIIFNAVAAPAFAFDNVRFGTDTAIPEPTTMSLMGFGLLGVMMLRRKR
jgi:PEP-CTERM motif-containing protein